MTIKQRYLNIWCAYDIESFMLPFSEDDQLYYMIEITTDTGISVSLFGLN